MKLIHIMLLLIIKLYFSTLYLNHFQIYKITLIYSIKYFLLNKNKVIKSFSLVAS